MIGMDSFRYVLAIAEEKNITKAASRMFITQPALTSRINRLENSLGIKIFDRSKSPIEITPEGELYITEMKKIKAQEELLRNTLLEMSHQKKKHLTLGIGWNRGYQWLPLFLPHMQQVKPELIIQIFESSDGDMEQLIKDGTIDVGIIGSAVLSQDLYTIPLGNERLFLGVPSSHEFFNDKNISDYSPENPCIISPELLNGQTFIFSRHPFGLTRFCNFIFSLFHITPGRILNVGNTATAYALSGAGIGITVTFGDYYEFPVLNTIATPPVFCTIENYTMERKTFLTCKQSRKDDKLVHQLAQEIQKLFY